MTNADQSMFATNGFEPLLERLVAGDVVTIFYHGLAVLSFDATDPIARDLVVHSLLALGTRGKTVAKLCGVSAAHVTGVRQRVDEGGTSALALRSKGGRRASIEGARLDRVVALRGRGTSIAMIATKVGAKPASVHRALKRLKSTEAIERPQSELVAGAVVSASATPAVNAMDSASEASTADESSDPELAWGEEELEPAALLRDGPVEHESRYTGTLLLAAAASALGIHDAIDASNVRRPKKARYSAGTVLMACIAAWTSGLGSLEAMHERDAAALGIVLGMERSPSVRTLHRALAQIVATYDPVAWNTTLMRGVAHAFGPSDIRVFGVDGHVKPYKGDAPIDKGWDAKRRLAVKALADVRVSDDRGVTWWHIDVAAGDALSAHVLRAGEMLRATLGTEQPIVLALDRGGFDFSVLAQLDRSGLYYVLYVPATVKMPALEQIAPAGDGAGDVIWTHESLAHPSRLVVERDGDKCIPIATNLPTLVDPATVVELLRDARGWQENSIKAARAFAHIDRLVDRGGATYAPDDRSVPNPAHAKQLAAVRSATQAAATVSTMKPIRGKRTPTDIDAQQMLADLRVAARTKTLGEIPARVKRIELEPDAQRAWLKTRNRLLLSPLKHAAENSRRWLLGALGSALSPSDGMHDESTRSRTLLALFRAPGSVRFEHGHVRVTIRLNLPPKEHARLAAAIESLDDRALLFTDGERRVTFRLAPRTMRGDVLPRASEI